MLQLIFQVLGKSAKPIPVMILGILFARKRYPWAKFLFVLMIVLGVAMFLYKDSGQSKKSDSDSLIGMGEILLVCRIETLHSEIIVGILFLFIW